MRNELVEKLHGLIDSRNALTDPSLKPSDYWADFCNYFEYVFKLDDDELKYIRRHTYHLTSDIYQRYYFASKEYKQLILSGFDLFSGLLGGFVYDETEYGIGVEGPLCRVSHDSLRYLGILVDLQESPFPLHAPQTVLELGGGYGGLARCLLTYNKQCSYCICDLEETLFFSFVYLSNMLGEDKVHLIEHSLDQSGMAPGNVYLTPQSAIHNINGISFDLTINQQSLQEMKRSQVFRYIDFIKKHSRYFYSCNLDSHEPGIAREKGLVENLTGELTAFFGPPAWKGRVPEIQHSFGDHIPSIDRLLYSCGG